MNKALFHVEGSFQTGTFTQISRRTSSTTNDAIKHSSVTNNDMKTTVLSSSARHLFARLTSWPGFIALALPGLVLFLTLQLAHAGSATWNMNPTTGDWNTAANWTPMTVPNSPGDTATFGSSSVTAISTSLPIDISGVTFNSGASPFTITIGEAAFPNNTFYLETTGITNNSGVTQNFVITAPASSFDGGSVEFNGSASAGNMTVYTLEGGYLTFAGTSTATNSTFVDNGAMVAYGDGGKIYWASTGSPGNSTFVANGATVSTGYGGEILFTENAPTGNSTLIATPGPGGNFAISGGYLGFAGNNPGTPRVEVFGNAVFDLSIGSSYSIGSLEGTGIVSLGDSNVTVGTNNLSTTFSGSIYGEGASLIKTGKGTLTLSKASIYTGGTRIAKGALLVMNNAGSATGSGPVSVKAGALGGTGMIKGAVTVASGTTAALLAPGTGATPGTLTTQSTLTFGSLASYKVDLNSSTVTADQVAAKGITINAGAQIFLDDLGAMTLTSGTAFTILNNTAATVINGTFANLADGSTVVVGNNTYKANYEGGTGNDLTLTVQ